jgi:hypothetical protein
MIRCVASQLRQMLVCATIGSRMAADQPRQRWCVVLMYHAERSWSSLVEGACDVERRGELAVFLWLLEFAFILGAEPLKLTCGIDPIRDQVQGKWENLEIGQ